MAESVISIYNQHNNKHINIGEDTADDETFVVYNGPEIGESDDVLKEALNLHFRNKKGGAWHFSTNLFKSSGLTFGKILGNKNKLNI